MSSNTSRRIHLLGALVYAVVIAAATPDRAAAQLYINEIFFNPGGAIRDDRDEYIELRGEPGASLAGYYLIFIEGDDDLLAEGPAGLIDNVFDLNYNAASPELGQSFGTNGFLTLRQKDSRYTVAAGTNDRVNMGSGVGWGSGVGASSIGAANELDTGVLENSAFTAMIVHKDGDLEPTVGIDVDVDNNGLDTSEDLNHWSNNWTIVDAIGLSASQEVEDSEFARLYAPINFFADFAGAPLPPTWEPRIEVGAEHEVLTYEFEFAARWGNSTGQTAADWHISNLTDNFGSGYVNNTFLLRQSGDPHPPNDGDPNTPPVQPAIVETNQGVPYGTILTNTLGAPNYLKGDYNKDGVVDAADYVVWRKSVGQTGSEFVAGMPTVANHHPADGDHSFLVDEADYALWRANFGAPHNSGGTGTAAALESSTVPEPTGAALAILALLSAASLGKSRQFCGDQSG